MWVYEREEDGIIFVFLIGEYWHPPVSPRMEVIQGASNV